MNGELGVTYGFTSFDDFTLRQPNGQTWSGPSGLGSNIVARAGSGWTVQVGRFAIGPSVERPALIGSSRARP